MLCRVLTTPDTRRTAHTQDGNNKQKPRREGFDPLPTDANERIYQKNEGEWEFTLGEVR